MQLRLLLIASLIFTTLTSQADEQQWLQQQWQLIPANIQVAMPSPYIPIEKVDKHLLATKFDPVLRNQYINHTYHLIGKAFNHCMQINFPFGNWYFFASWASKSAGEIISGHKFKSLNGWQEFWVNILQLTKVLDSKQQLKQIFASVNQMIAIEMIPLGKSFLQHFCTPDAQLDNKAWQRFNQLMLKHKPEERLLQKAFYHYFLAIKEKDINLKKEHITLAATLQVISEQMRVDKPIKHVFDARGPHPIKDIIQEKCTAIGDYKMIGNNSITRIKLAEDIKNVGLDHDLKQIELPELRQLYQQQNTKLAKNQFYVPATACRNWGDLQQRKRFLTAMFWIYINKSDLLFTPEHRFQSITTLTEWSKFALTL